ncbi:MAG: hypothetical protein A2Z05_00665 [Chloroflexi bacterium RBG_16_60_22]|nr:MAG: hypothetical protein A2Z05_00665 [Chloroflexi bacterium RBG_16_60_22]
MTEFGYAGEILRVDLSGGKISKLPTADYAERFLGGRGIAARLYWEMVPPETAAFDAANCLVGASGPVAGFPGFAGSRWVICGKSPAGETDSFSYANLGERWGAWLKYAGYDALAVTGKAERPVYLYIDNDTVAVRDAAGLWGKTTFEAADSLKAELGKDVAFLAIGPAAENLVTFASVLSDGGASGSGGLGAVMGSKQLKAIVVKGKKRPVAAHPGKLPPLARLIRDMRRVRSMPSPPWALPGITRDHICYGCGIGCSRKVYTGQDGQRYKSFCQASGFYRGRVIDYYGKWHEAHLLSIRLCDAYGLDTSVMHGMIDWLAACYREGLLTGESTGLPLSRIGSAEFIEALTRKIADREGYGDILARGTIFAAGEVGGKAGGLLAEAVATRRSETRDYDPRLLPTTALLYATEPRRPISQLHEISIMLLAWLNWARKNEGAFFSSDDFREAAARFWGGAVAADFSTFEGKATAAKKIQDRTYAKESLVLCDLRWPMTWANYPGGHVGDPTLESRVLAAITGRDIDEAGLNRIGERIFNLQRAILLRQGWPGSEGDCLLDYFHEEPLREGEVFFDAEGIVPGKDGRVVSRLGAVVDRGEFERVKSEYYNLRGWDTASGLPTRAGLKKLRLDDVAADLAGRGLLK